MTTEPEAIPADVLELAEAIANRIGVTPTSESRPYVIRAAELAIIADRASRPPAAGGTKLVALMSEAIPALEATGCNVSLVKDLRAAVAAIPTPSANAQDVGELVLTEIKRLRPYYQTITATDAGRRQMLDHFENMIAAHKRTTTDDVA